MALLMGFTPKGLIPMEIIVHPYIPMILPTSSQRGTLVVYPTFWRKLLCVAALWEMSLKYCCSRSLFCCPSIQVMSLVQDFFLSTRLEELCHKSNISLSTCSWFFNWCLRSESMPRSFATVTGPRVVHISEYSSPKFSSDVTTQIQALINMTKPETAGAQVPHRSDLL